ncbi:MAG: hypothetical protein JSW60_03615 [Thermoplasmatales archaeon]|nr:MAG: hypothetical protein JSW60_03615 [Thermoplasmatales archaeon]
MKHKPSLPRSTIQTSLLPAIKKVLQPAINVAVKYTDADDHSACVGGAGGDCQEEDDSTDIFLRGGTENKQKDKPQKRGF